MEKKRVCVVGGAGYIGSRLVPHLVARGHEVEVIDALWFGNNLDESIKVTQADVLRLPEESWRGFDAVVFLGGFSNDPMAEFAPNLNAVHNIAAPAYVAISAKRMGVPKFVYADSCSDYGNTGGSVCTEEHPATSIYPYGVSKFLGGKSVLSLAEKSFSPIALRLGTVSGASPRMRFDLLVNTMYKSVYANKKLTVRNPDIWRPLLALSDAVVAFTVAVESSPEVQGIYNVASENVTVGETAERISAYFASKLGMTVPVDIDHIPDGRDYRASTEKVQKDLGVTFSGSVETILDELSKQFPPEHNFEEDGYYNIRVFKKLLEDTGRERFLCS